MILELILAAICLLGGYHLGHNHATENCDTHKKIEQLQDRVYELEVEFDENMANVLQHYA